jgi:hypothetical protein
MSPPDPDVSRWATDVTGRLTAAASEAVNQGTAGDLEGGNQRLNDALATLSLDLNGDDAVARIHALIKWMSIELATQAGWLATQAGVPTQEWLRQNRERARVAGALDPQTTERLISEHRRPAF